MQPYAGNLRDAWRAHADDWAAWASTPDHDVFFWRYNLPAFLELVPPALDDGPTVDVGCGEGRVARALTALGHRVVGVDAALPLALRAAAGDPPVPAATADAVALPIRSHCASLAIAFMVLQDVDDLDAVLAEIARVLAPGGRLCFNVIHPLASSGDFVDDDDADADFLVYFPYSETRRFRETAERDGLTMTFHSEHRPLEAYVDALAGAGFVVERLREPVPDAAVLADVPRLRRQQRVPWYVHVRARLDA